jgi:hypothetical protein
VVELWERQSFRRRENSGCGLNTVVAVTEGGGLEWYIPLLTTEGRKIEPEGFSTRGSVVCYGSAGDETPPTGTTQHGRRLFTHSILILIEQ